MISVNPFEKLESEKRALVDKIRLLENKNHVLSQRVKSLEEEAMAYQQIKRIVKKASYEYAIETEQYEDDL